MVVLHITLARENGPDVIGICDTYSNNNVTDNLLTIAGFDQFRKDRSETREKTGGGSTSCFHIEITVSMQNWNTPLPKLFMIAILKDAVKKSPPENGTILAVNEEIYSFCLIESSRLVYEEDVLI